MARGNTTTTTGSSSNIDMILDQASPYYVHSSDGPSSVTMKPVLNGSNYHSWARSMCRALGGKMKYKFVNGTIPPVLDPFDPTYRAWHRCNDLIHSCLLNSVSESIAQSIVFIENVVDAWNDLKDRFAQGDLVRVSELMQEIYTLKQDSKSVTEFYSELKILWEELETYMPIPTCVCHSRCSCDSMIKARSNHTLLYAIRFLTGLNENCGMVKPQILLIDPLPPMTKIFSMVLQFERQHGFGSNEESKVLVNAVDSKKQNYYPSKGNSQSSKGNMYCTYCHKTNHTINECFKKHEQGGSSRSNTPSISQEQYDQLMALLKNSSVNHSSTSTSSQQANPSTSVNHSLTDKRVKEKKLNMVLMCSGGCVALLGVEKLICPMCEENLGKDAMTQFTHSSSRKAKDNQKMIGSVDKFEDLYYLNLQDKETHVHNISTSKTLPTSALWHFRLGHISASRMSLMFSDFHLLLLIIKLPVITKLAPRARKCVFLGYKAGMKGVVLFDLNNRNIFISRNVTHHETLFPYQPNQSSSSWSYYPSPPHINSNFPQSVIDPNIPANAKPSQPHLPTSTLSNETSNTLSHPISEPSYPISSTSKPKRQKHVPTYLKDYVCNSSSQSVSSIISGTPYPISNFHSYANLSGNHKAFYVSLSQTTKPKTYSETCKSQEWIDAMNSELEALYKNGTWDIIDAPVDIKPIGSKWVFKVKHKADGSIERFKARLVTKGYNQIEGLDFFDTFSPVAKLTTVRALLALASHHHWHLHQLDVNNARLVTKGYNQIEGLDFFDTFSPVAKLTTVRALLALASHHHWHLHQLDVNNVFLHGDLHEDVYMQVPEGFLAKPNQEGYHQSSSDYSLFTFKDKTHFTAILVYVDDIIIAGSSTAEIERIKIILDRQFKIKDLGSLKYFLGLEVAQSSQGITISQRKYCLDLLEDTCLLGSKPVSTPLDPSLKLHQDNGALFEDITQYRRLIGRLLYLTTTRPDISLATQQLSQFLQAPTITHYNAACRILRYLKQEPGLGLMFPRDSELQLLGFADADWAGCVDSRKSTTGYCFFLGSSLISWKAKKQETIARSSSKAEYIALTSATCELQWLLYLLEDLNVKCSRPPVLYCDSQSAIHIASNPVFHERTKHLEIDCHLIREKLQKGILKLLSISTNEQVADFLTKPLVSPKFKYLLSKLNMINIFS
ncbi:hypothetical protein TSUD_185270 [Trifolium subterraneum]|uniref:Reverse transcriptase Ty1/copia-type domain-containing protein n=1 Tax=Trifolium subterraneum TaxID=3900 RepID=A0A2Z6PV79_TRISU|nr:hypothetical protein TSUD_185270 [Trifolium subterraneum]